MYHYILCIVIAYKFLYKESLYSEITAVIEWGAAYQCLNWIFQISTSPQPFSSHHTTYCPRRPAKGSCWGHPTINKLLNDVDNAHDNLLLSKISQTHYMNQSWNPDPIFPIGNMVMLSTTNCWHVYKKKDKKCAAKFFPWWDGLYKITDYFPQASTYTLQIGTSIHPIFHILQLKHHIPNDHVFFPSQVLSQPSPLFITDGLKEYLVSCQRNYWSPKTWLRVAIPHMLAQLWFQTRSPDHILRTGWLWGPQWTV